MYYSPGVIRERLCDPGDNFRRSYALGHLGAGRRAHRGAISLRYQPYIRFVSDGGRREERDTITIDVASRAILPPRVERACTKCERYRACVFHVPGFLIRAAAGMSP